MQNLKLNLKHLRYFWAVATHGTIVQAAEALFITPQTISGQLKELESQIGSELFRKEGRKLVLTETGRLVFSYADEMFRLGVELQDMLSGRTQGTTITLKVGVAMVVPKLLAYRVLEPVLQMSDPVKLICHEAPLVDLLADLSVHKLDMVLADSPINPSLNIRAYNHALGESGITFFAASEEAQRLRAEFPVSLDGQNILMPSSGSSLRRNLEIWFQRQQLEPIVVAEFEDRALMKTFGERGTGVFTSPTAVEQDVIDKYRVEVVGRSEEITESFYVISPERHIKHPAINTITQVAKSDLFG
ncbi:MAG: transcriptional activator NhaR [Candidatus Thiodiazotropha sp. (ex Lucina aurantia)]|uniref:Transcriptional activator protein NhaR n=2 Tax=Candidatus Thiodiazotropha TaxID=1913444 RepID=A0A7Z0VNA2_9GAMM|nr:transcriptional activator NhaR [Candidatus Thiodiazotropha endolucinida]MBT3012763.1 transcriptional activator NhaR [Candidatus Thiodiazotropha sp. (ex Lucina pensylvanica)]MBT3014851.1 transcriptional activator NhaR [Candidatus Thiodiazotropha taylori]MBT3039600.1 transcriptional activator NhaR [Candidatus Thiodiazotropha sp. (ex Codakia orbicularis)]MBV2103661.1 transcriptional activator NhaR [Candidatus Thiodiazotropha sp. (ex Lucina aurantia)]MBT3024126.1 transcriptional activator NhaR 